MVDILLVEDNKELSGLMSRFLVNDGYTVFSAFSAEAAYECLKTEKTRIIILDIMLPGDSGFDFCEKIRKIENVPIIFLSALVDKDTKLKSFLVGADDYLEKPVDIDLLSAKVSAVLKREYGITDKYIIKSGELSINQNSMEVFWGGNKIYLSVKEYNLLLLLVENEGKTLSKEFLFSKTWGDDCDSESQTLTVHIKTLRDKIEKNPKDPKRIITVWGMGYRYEKI